MQDTLENISLKHDNGEDMRLSWKPFLRVFLV